MSRADLRLISSSRELVVSIDSRSWHVLDEPDLFPEGALLRKAFGVTWASGLFKKPPFGILQHLPATQFQKSCQTVWTLLLRDRELLSYSYLYELEQEKGVQHGGGMGNAFHVRGLLGSIKATPKGYCTVRLRGATPAASGRFPTVEIIDMRKVKKIETDDAGYLKVYRRAMTVDWYREMPRILDFCDQIGMDRIEVRLADD